MKKRNSNIDCFKKGDYVQDQNVRFEIFAKCIMADEYVVDYMDNEIDRQQKEITQIILKTIYKWQVIDQTLHIYNYRLPKLNNKIAVFDLDNTLIEIKNGNITSFSKEDYHLKYTNIKKKLLKLLKNNYTIVIVTADQSNKRRKMYFSHSEKIKYVADMIGLPMMILISVEVDKYRIPKTGMMEYLFKLNSNLSFSNSFYVGDNMNGTTNVDSKYARACNLKFFNDHDFFYN